MPNVVSFKIQIEGSDSIKTVTFSADELGKALKAVRDSSERLNGSIVNWAQAGQAAEILGSMVQNLSSAFKGLSDAYAAQEAAETRLAQAMRNTMGATAEDIDAIKQLCSAQQQLGIIGDEVQMSGAQELATYLEKRSSLERLIPVMNDMLAQQYEYNATSENAAQIASMLGKVMNGQTEALSRYGYKFDEAQKQVLQFGTEEERAAVLAEVVQQSVGGMNAAMARTPVGIIKQMSDRFGDLGEQLGAVATHLMPVLQGFAALTTVGTGIGKTISSIKSLTAALKAAGLSAKAMHASLLGIAGVALVGIVTGLGIMASKTREAREEAEKANEEYRAMQERLASARSEIEIDIQKLTSFNGSIAEEKRLVGEMNSKWGETFGTFNTVSEWYKALSENVDAYCTRLANQIELEKIANDIANAKNDTPKLQERLDFLKQQREAVKNLPMITGGGEMGMVSPFQAKSTSGFDQQIAELEATIRSKEETISNGETRMQELLADMAAIALPSFGPGGNGGAGNGSSLADDIESYRKSVKDAVQVNNLFNGGQNATEVRLRAMESGIASLIRKYGAESTEVQKLIKEYQDLAVMRAGSIGSSLPVGAIQSTNSGPRPSVKDFKSSTFDWSSIESGKDGIISIQDAAGGASSAIGALSEAMGSLGGVIGEGAAGWLIWGANLLKAIGQALPALSSLFAAQTAVAGAEGAASVASIPFIGPVMAVAAVASIAAAIASLPKFANGGLIYGPTIGLMGEYAGARTNPEFVGKVSDIQKYIQPAAGPSRIVGKLSGRDIILLEQRMRRFDARNNG